MEIVVHQNIGEILAHPLAQRPEALRRVLAPLYRQVPVPGDPVDLHHLGGGFRVDADFSGYHIMLEKIIAHDVPGQIEYQLQRAWERFTDAVPGIQGPQRLQVMLMLGNPDDDYLMRVVGGYYGMSGATPGWLYLLAWPTDDVVDRIAHCAVHEFHHQVRYSNVEWDPVRVTVGEHIVVEGLAEAFVRELSGPEAMGPWSSRVTGAAFDDAYAKTMANIDLPGMGNTPAFVLGDTAAARFGGEPRGIADMAGYGVGLRIVDKHLAATGLTAAESSVLPSAKITAHSVK
ncbi:MAG TPA: DUF2268 domain-containing putative Zn-dependent protease [Candidatus Limnocylindrales bacterium]|nr:DUF2268 domain-containing putative Zn-dependent protease [Candidatus Limnocylindrales bacterium]